MNFANIINKSYIKNYTLGYIIIALMLMLISCSSKTEKAANEISPEPSGEQLYKVTSKQFEASNMVLGKIEQKPFHEIVRAKGMIDVPPQNRAEVSSFFGGTVKEINLLPGEQVRKGQVLLTLENPDYVQVQQDYLQSQRQLAYLESDYERQKNLAEDSVSSQKKFLKAKSDYRVTQAKIASLAKILLLMNIDPNNLGLENIRSTITVKSPIDGFVTEVAIAQGAFLTPSNPAIKIVNTDHIHLELKVFEKDLAKMSIGHLIQFRIQDDNNQTYEATIKLINKNVDKENRTVAIHGHLVDEKLSQKLNPGMYVEADIYTTSEERWALPIDALVDVEGKYNALVLTKQSDDEYIFVKREVKTGLSNNKYIEILNPQNYEKNPYFLIKGAFNLITE